MNDSGSKTHRPRAIDPANFRAQATGIGQSLGASRMTGAARALEVVEHMPPRQRAAVPAAEGYPTAPFEGMAEAVDMEDASSDLPGLVVSPTKVNGSV
jgi:hypothetical protein